MEKGTARRLAASAISLSLIVAACGPAEPTYSEAHSVYIPPATATSTEMPTLTPDPDLTATVYCADVESGGNVTTAVQKALAESGSQITLESAKNLGWYIAMFHDGKIFVDTAKNVLDAAPGTESFNTVSIGDPTCIGETGSAARMHLHRSIEPQTMLPNHARIFSRINSRFSPTAAAKPVKARA